MKMLVPVLALFLLAGCGSKTEPPAPPPGTPAPVNSAAGKPAPVPGKTPRLPAKRR